MNFFLKFIIVYLYYINSISCFKGSLRIVNGSRSDILKHPYQASILLKNKYHCSGSIISERFILTAGHCAYKFNRNSLKIRIGSSHCCKGGIVADVKKIYVHKKYDQDSPDYDIAILKLNGNLKRYFKTDQIEPIILTGFSPTDYAPMNAVVSGWGTTVENGKHVTILRDVVIQVLEQDYCHYLLPGISKRMFCAGGNGKDSCEGDSGGPLVVNGYIQIGIVSWGIGCGEKSLPGVYTNVFKFRNWIEKITKQ